MTDPQDILQQRRQFAEELLLERGELRANLDDTQAERLLQWALGLVEEMVAATAVLDDATAEAAIEDGVQAIANVIAQVDHLTPDLPNPATAPAEAQQAAQPLRQALHALTGVDSASFSNLSGSRPETEQLVYSSQVWDNDAAFNYLYQIVTWEQEEE
jgi:hypothetical protein